MKLTESFFQNKNTVSLAKDLIGKVLVKKTKDGIISGIINETEAYIQTDEASHCYLGRKTVRNEVMFKQAGHLYVYFTYGMYHCLNVVSEKEGYGSAVLIRSVIPLVGADLMIKNRKWNNKDLRNLSNGPAKVCMAFGVTKNDNGINLLHNKSNIYIEDIGYKIPEIKVSKRIGISKGVDKDRRFYFE